MTYQPKVYREQGGAKQVVASGGELEVQSGGELDVVPVDIGASLTASKASHNGHTLRFSAASGSALTLPAATGSGLRLRCLVATTVTSNNHTIACAGTDEFAGTLFGIDTDTGDAIVAYPAVAADNFDTITMDGSTKGGLQGDWIELEDVASGVWAVHGVLKQTGAPASPFSAS